MNRKVFVQLPSNNPSGGIKVGNQLVNLFREHNYESYIVLPREVYQADWLINPAPTINIKRMQELCKDNDIVIDNWIDNDTIIQTKQLKARTKVFYLQGCTFYKSRSLIGDEFLKNDLGYTHFWVVSTDSLKHLANKYSRIKKWYLVHPYLNFKEAEKNNKGIDRKRKILAFSRKGKDFVNIARLFYKNRIDFTVIDNFTEEESYKLYASHKFFLSTCISARQQYIRNIIRFLRYGNTEHNYSVIIPIGHREGFPLPPTEVAMCGSIVIGFAMGGGLEWMSPDTCFLAKDRNYFSLMKKIKEALSASDEQLNIMKENTFRTVSKFNKEHT